MVIIFRNSRASTAIANRMKLAGIAALIAHRNGIPKGEDELSPRMYELAT